MRKIGSIGNYYGYLEVKECEGKFYWAVEDCTGHWWEEIPEYLYNALNKFEDERKIERGE